MFPIAYSSHIVYAFRSYCHEMIGLGNTRDIRQINNMSALPVPIVAILLPYQDLDGTFPIRTIVS